MSDSHLKAKNDSHVNEGLVLECPLLDQHTL